MKIQLPGETKLLNTRKPVRPFNQWGINHPISKVETLRATEGKAPRYDPTNHPMFKRYKWSPLYFKRAFQYMWGGLFRAIEGLRWWGYRDDEEDAQRILDTYLTHLDAEHLYKIQVWEIREFIDKDVFVRGIPWSNYSAAPPKVKAPKYQRSFRVPLGGICYTRLCTLPGERYVDLDFYSKDDKCNRVIRMQISQWRSLLRKFKPYRGADPFPDVKPKKKPKVITEDE